MPDPAVGSATKMPHDDVTSATRSAPGVATRRDSGLTALILGFFAAVWLNWTPEASGALADALQIGRAVGIHRFRPRRSPGHSLLAVRWRPQRPTGGTALRAVGRGGRRAPRSGA